MYPGTQFNWIDQSFIGTGDVELDTTYAPLFMSVGSADKGPEKFMEVDVNNFNKLYGAASFTRHGQNSIQNQNLINAGGRLFFKRIVAADSKLANVIILAKITPEQKLTQAVDEDGNLLYYTDETMTQQTTDVTDYPVMVEVYLDDDGNETTEVTGTPALIGNICWEAQSIENVAEAAETGFDKIKAQALAMLDIQDVAIGVTSTFPVFVIADNGRGTSIKAIRLTPDYNTSKGIGTTFYQMDIVENASSIESFPMTIDPDIIYANTAYRLDRNTCIQLAAEVVEETYQDMIDYLADITMIESDTLRKYDFIFGATYTGAVLDAVKIDDASLDFNATVGIPLSNGSNGVFGEAPCADKTSEAYAAWTDAIANVFAGNVTDEIYDVDQHMVAAVLDAAFPNKIKKAIAEMVTFRKDCVYLRDIGIGHYTFSDIKAAVNQLPKIPYDKTANDCDKFVADYVTSYQIIDPETQKNIEVTMLYDMASVLVDHLHYRANSPAAGIYNGFILKSAIKGTVNFTPINTPKVNQKQAMEDLRVNYAIFEYNDCVVQTLYTCQQLYTQLSYLNNVFAIQWVLRAIRSACPKNRYSLANGVDLSNYAAAVTRVLDDFRENFDVLEFEYTTDSLKAQQKIFYASIRFAFLNWAQTEIFDVYAIANA